MGIGPNWLCTEMQTVRRNLHRSDAEISAMLGRRTPYAVQSFRLAHGLKKQRRIGRAEASERAERIIAMYLAGTPVADIARELGCCHKSASAALRRAGAYPEKRSAVQ